LENICSRQTFVRFSVHRALDNIAVTMAIIFLSGVCFAHLSCRSIRLTILEISEVLQYMATNATAFSNLEDVEGIDMSLGDEQKNDWS
jgi:hypothetical protein